MPCCTTYRPTRSKTCSICLKKIKPRNGGMCYDCWLSCFGSEEANEKHLRTQEESVQEESGFFDHHEVECEWQD